MDKMCRACLVAKDTFQYTLFENLSADVYSFCTSVEICKEDDLPKTVCNICYEMLEKYSDFKRVCIQAQSTLQNMRDSKHNIDIKCESLLKYEDNDPKDDQRFSCDEDAASDEIIEQKVFHKKVKKEQSTKKKPQIKIKKRKELKHTKKTQIVFSYDCEICKRKFKYKDRYEAHKLEHQGQTVKKSCPSCKKTFMTWSGLQRHINSEHNVVHLNSLRCNICGKVFKNIHTLKMHSKLHSKADVSRTVCDVCGKSLASHLTLKVHLESHNANRPRDFPCEHCGKKFFTKSILNSHIKRLHTGQRFICGICEYPFTDKFNLSKHILTHQGIKEHKCDICNKMYSTNSALVIHKRIHSGERPYSCEYCARAFNCKNTMVVHQRTHTGERPYRCQICNLAFTQISSLKTHVKTHNKVTAMNNGL